MAPSATNASANGTGVAGVDLDEPVRAAWENVFVAHRRISREVEKRLHDAGLPPLAWYDVLYTLYKDEGGSMKQTALAARVQVSPSGLSRLLDRMVAREVVERREVPGDRRATELVLTEDGVELMREIWEHYGGVLAEHFGPAAAGHEEEIARVFEETSDSLQGTCDVRIAEAEQACEEASEACDEIEAGRQAHGVDPDA